MNWNHPSRPRDTGSCRQASRSVFRRVGAKARPDKKRRATIKNPSQLSRYITKSRKPPHLAIPDENTKGSREPSFKDKAFSGRFLPSVRVPAGAMSEEAHPLQAREYLPEALWSFARRTRKAPRMDRMIHSALLLSVADDDGVGWFWRMLSFRREGFLISDLRRLEVPMRLFARPSPLVNVDGAAQRIGRLSRGSPPIGTIFAFGRCHAERPPSGHQLAAFVE
jgi:hypothetical protein